MGDQNIQGAFKHMGSIQTYRSHPNIWGHPNIPWVLQTYGVSKHTVGIQTYGGIQMYGAYGHPLSLTKHAFFVLYMYSRHPNIIQKTGDIQTYRGPSNHMGKSKHLGGIQSYGSCPDIQGESKYSEGIQTWGVSKHTGGI